MTKEEHPMATSGSGHAVADAVLTEAARDITTTKQEIDSEITALRHQLEELNSAWLGLGGAAFRRAIVHWEGTAAGVISAMDTFHDSLVSSEATYHETEDVVAARLNKYAALGGVPA
ncbi:WXG100 family type VII secretion target [Nocardioides sp. AE5]|uniref:WXG100 family type VII secretion target n=1 Tax=Nocardioides sp. AE5 TaxID=2962573 RepID=UPI002881EB96|nr:WXG100 family type VII secretion target [Nocardioides sp. AE5]MDT0200501.1 WXG100 family type VII secretion target [Nocardioides sp. AE5]